jgi:hypothetical protein
MKLALVAVALVAAALSSSATAAMHPELGAKLLGKNERPTGSPTGHGIVNLTLNASKGSVCWAFDVVGIGKPAVAHIHKGAAGKTGAIVVPLGAKYKAKGCTKASKKTVEAIEARPNAYYVNVHTAKYPGGAIRGQLVVGMVHM